MSKSYVAARDGFVLGTSYKTGDPVEVIERQAKYLAAPFGDQLNEVGSKKAPKAPPSKLTSTTSDRSDAEVSK